MRTASNPAAMSGPCGPMPSGNASRATARRAGRGCHPAELLADRLRRGALEADAPAARVSRPGDHGRARGGRLTQRRDIRSRRRSGPVSRADPPAVPCPPLPGSIRRPRRALASCWRAAPRTRGRARSAPRCPRRFPPASGTPAASRAATTTIWRRELPARLPITFTRSSLPRSKRSTSTVNPRLRKAFATSRAAARSPGRPARLSRAAPTIAPVVVTALWPTKTTSAGRPCPSGLGRLSRENITSTTASTVGRNAAL